LCTILIFLRDRIRAQPHANWATSKRSDLELVDNKGFFELKSWDNFASGAETIASRMGGSAFGQFKAYLQNITDLSQLRYSFDIGKIKPPNSYFPDLPLEQRQKMLVKEQFQKFFERKGKDLIKPIKEGGIGVTKFMELFGVNNISDFNDAISDLNSVIYSFIKVE
jgi:hypothetical protein